MEDANRIKEASNEARIAILELANMISVPMSLNAVVRLNVADAIWQKGSNTPLSASQILERVLPTGSGDAENLQRILRMLTSYGVFSEHFNADGSERKFSLTEVGQTLASHQSRWPLLWGLCPPAPPGCANGGMAAGARGGD
ncbi:hypothetical protein ACLB2K_056348 [Fragaria x ananassa]